MSPKDVFLGQGTLRPDLIESASSLASNAADAIKTHHNDTELVRELRAQVIGAGVWTICILASVDCGFYMFTISESSDFLDFYRWCLCFVKFVLVVATYYL